MSTTLERVATLCAGALVLSTSALAENDIRQWSGPTASIVEESQVIILEPGTYKFEAVDVDPNDPNTVLGLGWIDEISLDPNCPSGTVSVYVLRDPNEGTGAGAKGVGEINLVLTGVTGNVVDVSTTVNLAYLGTIEADAITGEVTTTDIEDDILVDYFSGSIECASMEDLTVSEGLTGTLAIGVDGDYAGTMSFPDLPASAVVDITGTWSGTLSCSGDVAGDVSVYAVDESGWLDVTGTLSGGVRTSQDMLGSISAGELAGVIDCNRDFSGALYVGVCC
jgi:hypothetical protein